MKRPSHVSPFVLPVLTAAVVSSTLLVSAGVALLPLRSEAQTVRATTTVRIQRDSDPLLDTVANGRGLVNHEMGTVRAKGYGAPPTGVGLRNPAQARLMALGAARADALRTLAMSVSSIQVTANTTVKNYVLKSDTVQTSLNALLQSPRVVSEEVGRDGTAVVVLELPLYGEKSVAAAVFPEVLGNGSGRDGDDEDGKPVDAAPVPEWKGPDRPAVRIERVPTAKRQRDIGGGGELRLTPASDNGPFTSVLVDCRNIGAQAVMSPKLMDTAGREVYGTIRVSPEYAIETGIVSYPRSVAHALRVPRVGSRPLIVRALRVADKHGFNPVVSLEDADRILAANNRDHFLEKTAVIFLVDPVR